MKIFILAKFFFFSASIYFVFFLKLHQILNLKILAIKMFTFFPHRKTRNKKKTLEKFCRIWWKEVLIVEAFHNELKCWNYFRARHEACQTFLGAFFGPTLLIVSLAWRIENLKVNRKQKINPRKFRFNNPWRDRLNTYSLANFRDLFADIQIKCRHFLQTISTMMKSKRFIPDSLTVSQRSKCSVVK